MKLARALVSGVVGAAVVLVLFALVHWLLRTPPDLASLLGRVLVQPEDGGGDATAWAVGAALQLAVGAAAAVVYAAVFEYVTRRAGALAGLLVAVPHVVVAGLAVGLLPVHAGARTEALPGAFLAFDGWVAATCFVVAHLLFGALVGLWYGDTRHAAVPSAVSWTELRSAE